jgi:hypothetical protein
MSHKHRFVLLALAMFMSPLMYAQDAREIKWADLVPPSAEMQNPFLELTRDQLTFISDVAAVRDRQVRGDTTLTPAEIQTAQTLTEKLEKAGIDVDGLLAMRAEIAERGRAVVEELDGKVVRIPGYLLPLELRKESHGIPSRTLGRRLYTHATTATEPDCARQARSTGRDDGHVCTGVGNRAA